MATSNPVFCPVDDRSYSSMDKLKAHIQAAIDEGDQNHIDIYDLEGWGEKLDRIPTENWPGVDPVVEEGRN